MTDTATFYAKELAEAKATRQRLLDLHMDADAAMWDHTIMNLEFQVKYWSEHD